MLAAATAAVLLLFLVALVMMAAAAFAFAVLMLMAVPSAAAFAFLMIVLMMIVTAAALAFAVLMLMAVPSAAAFTFLMIVLMMVVTAAALAFAVLVLMAVSAAAAFTFLMIVLMMVVTAAALAFAVLVLMAVSAAAAFTFLMIVLMMAVTAAALAFAVLVLMAVSAAAAFAVMIVVVMVMVMTAAAGIFIVVTAAAAMRSLELDRVKGRFSFRDLKSYHLKHLGQIGQRQNSKTLFDLRNTNAAVNQRTSSFTQHIHVARHVEHLFNCRTNCPEAAFFINEYIIDFNRTKLIGRNAKFNFAFRRMNDLRKLCTLSGCERQCMSLVKQGLSGSGVGRQKLRKRGHIYLILLSGCAAVAGSSTSEKMKAALFYGIGNQSLIVILLYEVSAKL